METKMLTALVVTQVTVLAQVELGIAQAAHAIAELGAGMDRSA